MTKKEGFVRSAFGAKTLFVMTLSFKMLIILTLSTLAHSFMILRIMNAIVILSMMDYCDKSA